MPTLDDLRKGTSPVQIRILTVIWDYYLSKGKWPPRRVLHHEFRPNGRAVVQEAIQMLGGSIAYEGWGEGEVYRVTLLGVMLSEHRRAAEELLVKYLSFARDVFEETPERERVTSAEVQAALGLSDAEADLLGRLIFFDGLFGAGGGSGQGSWHAGLPHGVEDIADDVRGYLHDKLLSTYRPDLPTTTPDREREMFDRVSTVEVVDAPADLASETTGPVRAPFEGDLHPRIAKACADLYRGGHYAEAVFRAWLALENLVQEKSGRRDLSGSTLMEQVFSPNGPALAFNALADPSDKDEQKGMMLLFQGTVFAFRNPRAHKSQMDSPEQAFESILVISFLAKRLEQAQPFKKA